MRLKSYEHFNCPQPAEMMLSKSSSIKKDSYTCPWLYNVDIHLYAKFDQNVPCGTRFMTQGSCNIKKTLPIMYIFFSHLYINEY